MEAVKVIVAWGAFALFHSLTVSERYERWARHAMGEERFGACHRFLFTAYSAAATAAALLYVRSLPDLPLYRLHGVPPAARLSPRPDAKQRRHGGGRHRLFLHRHLFRGAPDAPEVRGGVPAVPTARAAVPADPDSASRNLPVISSRRARSAGPAVVFLTEYQ